MSGLRLAQTQGSIQVAPQMLRLGKHPHTRLQRQVTELQHDLFSDLTCAMCCMPLGSACWEGTANAHDAALSSLSSTNQLQST